MFHGIDTSNETEEEINKKKVAAFESAFAAGYRFRVAHPELTGRAEPDAKELDLYPESQDLRIQWGVGWSHAELEALLGVEPRLGPIGLGLEGAPIGALITAARKLRAQLEEK